MNSENFAQQELSLGEYVAKLPTNHRAARELATLEAENERLRKAEKLLREIIEPGVFGDWIEVEDTLLAAGPLLSLCEDYGYGAVLHHVAYLWARKHPGSAHTVAACVDVRRRMLREIRAFLGPAKPETQEVDDGE